MLLCSTANTAQGNANCVRRRRTHCSSCVGCPVSYKAELKNSRFSVIVVAAAKLALPKIFTGAFARPGTGMDFGLAFVTPWPQTVNLACKHNVVGAREY